MKTFSVTEAKPQLGSLVDKALRSEPVFIRRGTRLVQIVPAVLPEPIAIRPEGHFEVDEERAAFINSMPIDDRPLAQ